MVNAGDCWLKAIGVVRVMGVRKAILWLRKGEIKNVNLGLGKGVLKIRGRKKYSGRENIRRDLIK